jgi:hypothetical protein
MISGSWREIPVPWFSGMSISLDSLLRSLIYCNWGTIRATQCKQITLEGRSKPHSEMFGHIPRRMTHLGCPARILATAE